MSTLMTVVVFVVIGVVLIGAFADKARHDGADKAFYHLLLPASAVVVGVIAALTYQAGLW